ncbi:hypothetical protein M3484_00690 [Pseudomonas sp. GX19020]|uniref:hypothetical protein n=1 Tax=Pseudomonas sp. GX19020 TaxID=2942277 RepID=UPI0020186E66|nr:hypothetical protein [Pseudomonas sp. GX19020]MCL4065093.1 hypothetical protein [Pseudomonas sp. GX19020]
MMGLAMEPRHISILMEMDRAWLDQVYAKERAKASGQKTLPPMSKQPLSAALLDVMLK